MKKYFPLPLDYLTYSLIIKMLENSLLSIQDVYDDIEISEEEIVHCLKNLKMALFGRNKTDYTSDLKKMDCKTLNELYMRHYGITMEKYNGELPSMPKVTQQDLERLKVGISIICRYTELLNDELLY